MERQGHIHSLLVRIIHDRISFLLRAPLFSQVPNYEDKDMDRPIVMAIEYNRNQTPKQVHRAKGQKKGGMRRGLKDRATRRDQHQPGSGVMNEDQKRAHVLKCVKLQNCIP